MHVSDLALAQWRSYEQLVVQFGPGASLLLGANGQGKTNLVEALAYLATLSSHRVNVDRALLRQHPGSGDKAGQAQPTAAVVRARVGQVGEPRSQLLELELVQGGANRARLNRAAAAPRDLLGTLRTVMFAPEDLQLLRGDPAGRRRFLDEILTQLKPSYLGLRRDFDKVLRQRAAVLKQLARTPGAGGSLATDALASWNEALARYSGQIAAHRLCVVQSLAAPVADEYQLVSGGQKAAQLTFVSKLAEQEMGAGIAEELPEVPQVADGYLPDLSATAAALEQRYLRMIDLRQAAELRRASNDVGAHRDDFLVSVHGLPAKGYASQGETWSAVLALRLAQMEVLTSAGSTPVLILDDVFAELDESRRDKLTARLTGVEQVFITAAVAADVPGQLGAAVFDVTWDEQAGSAVVPRADSANAEQP